MTKSKKARRQDLEAGSSQAAGHQPNDADQCAGSAGVKKPHLLIPYQPNVIMGEASKGEVTNASKHTQALVQKKQAKRQSRPGEMQPDIDATPSISARAKNLTDSSQTASKPKKQHGMPSKQCTEHHGAVDADRSVISSMHDTHGYGTESKNQYSMEKKHLEKRKSPSSATTPSHQLQKGSDARPAKKQRLHSEWPFPTEFKDHFETSHQALADLEPALFRLAQKLGKSKAALAVYDPYYCMGHICQHYAALGFTNFIHEKRNFYADIEAGQVPDYDILVTNPPYSEEHKERILSFCAASGKPWALLMPNYIANKRYYTEMMEQQAGNAGAPFYLVPSAKYEYKHPQGAGHDSSPFFSIWFIHMAQHSADIFKWWSARTQKSCHSGASRAGGSGKVQVLRSVQDLQSQQAVPTWKRPNPKQRKKLKQLRGKAG